MNPEAGRVHVVSVLFNSAPTLHEFVGGLLDESASVGAVTLVDNGSTDGSAEAARSALAGAPFPVSVIEQANAGFAGGYAAAVRDHADDLAVLCLNPDVRLAPGTVADLLAVLRERADAGIVTAPLIDGDGATDTATRRRLPRLGGSALYAVLGRHTPVRWRYNARTDAPIERVGELDVTRVEATTGALMLLRPSFRDITTPAFDTDYWMYGEDLQLCADAAAQHLCVLVAERAPSLHLKGASSGRPRSLRSNAAFHRAMWTYARKNLLAGAPVLAGAVAAAVVVRFLLDEARNQPAKVHKRLRRRVVLRVAGAPA